MGSAALEEFERVGQGFDHAFKGLAGAARASRKIEDEFALARAGHCPREGCPRRLLDAFSAHHFSKPRDFFFDGRASHFGRYVARPESSSPGGEDGVAVRRVSPRLQALAQPAWLLGQALAT